MLEAKAINARDDGCLCKAMAYEDALYLLYNSLPESNYIPSVGLLASTVSARK